MFAPYAMLLYFAAWVIELQVANLSKMIHKDTGDVVMVVDESVEFRVHGVLFAAASDVFEKIL